MRWEPGRCRYPDLDPDVDLDLDPPSCITPVVAGALVATAT